MDWLADLNDQQRQAVEADDGPLSIVAGPGTGKTKTLTCRIVHLLKSNRAKASEILALTFTNKAAREMQERVKVILGNTEQPTIVTFHALAHTMLRLPAAETLVSDVERTIILQLLKKSPAGKGRTLRDISLLISRAKNQPNSKLESAEATLVDSYNAELRSRQLYDYDDLLLRLHEALQHSDFSGPTFQHILVDEFQDTNDLQYKILQLLNHTGNLFVIGDPLQSIYGFRGASADIFKQFEQDFPSAKRVRLITNYRSARQIVRLANAIFPDVPALQPYRKQAGFTQAVEVLNEYSEADWILNELESQVGGSNMLRSSQHHNTTKQRTFSDFAVVYRTHAVSRAVQATLEKSGIPYQVAGEGSPYMQPYVTAVIQSLAYLSGLAEAPTVAKLTPTQTATLLEPLKTTMHQLSLSELAQRISKKLAIADDKNANQFTGALLRHDGMPPAEYVRYVQALAEQDYYDPTAGSVTLLTIHAAKGLEFPVVLLIGAEEGVLPLSRADIVTDTKEERRLFYVAATRARDELYMLHAKHRGKKSARPSSFIKKLPDSVVTRSTDEAMAAQQRRQRKQQLKRRQTTLF